MKILALDSSTCILSIALIDDQLSSESSTLFEDHRHQARTDSSLFFEGLQRALQQHGKPDRIVVGLGPGSYNGLRTSIAAAQGVASSCHLPLIGLPSILALEAAAMECWAIGDARGGEYWIAALSHHKLLEGPALIPPCDLELHLKRHPHFPVIATQELPRLLSSAIKLTIETPHAVLLARLGREATPALSLEPLYLKQAHITMPRPSSA
jgi:tRNA threonylcarbamoyl adenosine modification protein YeaZ